jgi:hypothetical protein
MANDFSDYADGKLLDELFGGTDFTPPGTLYVSAHTADPGKTGASEVASSNAYARVSVTNNTTNFPASSGSPRSKTNGATITFPQASGSWGTVTYIGFWDASTAGNFVSRGALGTSVAIAANNTLYFNSGDITITLN